LKGLAAFFGTLIRRIIQIENEWHFLNQIKLRSNLFYLFLLLPILRDAISRRYTPIELPQISQMEMPPAFLGRIGRMARIENE